MHVHLIGVAGTGMGALAGLLKAAGHRVTGSDVAFYPPMGEALKRWGVETMEGYSPDNLVPAPDRVVVGNVCRPDHVEARAAIDQGMKVSTFPHTLRELFLEGRPVFAVAGTHGKTTTSTLLSYLLYATGRDPGFLIGGLPRDFEESYRVGGQAAPFVVEGDEYDTAFFEKTPKLWHYGATAAILTSVEHDHIDIYPDAKSYKEAFLRFVRRMPEEGLLVAWAGSEAVREVASEAACEVAYYALTEDDCGPITPTLLGAPIAAQGGAQPFELFIGGSSAGRVFSPLSGRHNIRNALAAMLLAADRCHIPLSELSGALRRFGGVKRRQELLGVADGVRVYDDFAHHPSAVRETLAGLRARHPEGQLIAAFEPRSATACRNLHQEQYPGAFEDADRVLLAPLGRASIAESERLDLGRIARETSSPERPAEACESLDQLLTRILESAAPGDTLVLMSNGAFGGLHDRVLAALALRAADRSEGS